MEVVEKLSQVETNMEIIRQCMEERVYGSIIRLLTIHDVQLLLGALEVLLALSERGEVFCTRIATVEKTVGELCPQGKPSWSLEMDNCMAEEFSK